MSAISVADRASAFDTGPYESSARTYGQNVGITFAGGAGSSLIAENGDRYLDLLTGAGVALLGHNHPQVIRALDGLGQAIVSSLDLATTIRRDFFREFIPILPAGHDFKVHCCGSTGSDAVEALLKLARIATGRSGVFAFCGGYHGMSQGALSVTSNRRVRAAGLRATDNVTFCQFPYPYRGIGPYADEDMAAELAIATIESLILDDHSGVEVPGVILLECIQGEGGNIVAPPQFLRRLRDLCDAHGILLAIDEIQSGMGRTGRWFSFEHFGVVPDLFLVSKGIGGGFPMSLLVYRKELDLWRSGEHIGTFRGQSYAFAAGRAVIRTIRDEGILSAVAAKGLRFKSDLAELVDEFPAAGEVRGIGLFLGLECNAFNGFSGGDVARKIQERLLEARIVIERGGRGGAVLRFLPPLTISPAELDRVIAALRSAFQSLGLRNGGP